MSSDQNILNFINLCKNCVSEQNWRLIEDTYKYNKSEDVLEATYGKNYLGLIENIIKDIYIRLKLNPLLLKIQIESIDPILNQYIILNNNELDEQKLALNLVLKLMSLFPESRYTLESKNLRNPVFSFKDFDTARIVNITLKELNLNNNYLEKIDFQLKIDRNINEDFILNIKGISIENEKYKLEKTIFTESNNENIQNNIQDITSIEINPESNSEKNDLDESDFKIDTNQSYLFEELRGMSGNVKELNNNSNLKNIEEIEDLNSEETANKENSDIFEEIKKIELKPDKFLVLSKTDKGYWINEFINKKNYSGNTTHGFGFNIEDKDIFISAVEDTLKNSKENRIKWMGSENSELVITKNPSTVHKDKNYVDLRKFIHTAKYTGYTKKGIRLFEEEFIKFFNEFKEIIK